MTVSIARLAPTTSTRVAHEQPHSFAGFTRVLRFIVRRDRVRAPVWVSSVLGVVIVGAASVVAIYETPEDLQSYAVVAQADAAIKAITGPGYGLDDPTQGAVVMNEMSMFTLVGVALMCIFMVIRHTRAEEETDRAELVRAAPIGRHAALAATMLWVGSIVFAIGVGTAIGYSFWLPVAGSIAFAASVVGFGLVFIGVAAVTAQIASSARTATSTASAVLGVMFVLRAVGDMGNGWMTWTSPLGWAQGIRAYSDERWWVLLLLGALFAALATASVSLSARRDLGHGLFTGRPGPPDAAAWLATPLALSVRLQRGAIIGWIVGLGLMAFFMGVVADQAEALAENDAIADMMAQAGQGTFTESFLATIVAMVALIASGFSVSSMLRARSEERAERVAPMLATPISRDRWLASYVIVAVVGTVAVMLVAGLLIGVGYAVALGDASELLPLIAAAAIQIPALCVLAGFAAALIAIRPTLAPLAWVAVAFVALVGFLGETLDLPQWLRNVSPFEHVPALPAASFDMVPVAATSGVALALIGVAMIGIRHRDLG